MQVLPTLRTPTYNTDFNLFCLHCAAWVNISMKYGDELRVCRTPMAIAGLCSDRSFNRYRGGLPFHQARGVTWFEKHGFIAYQAKVQNAMGIVCGLDAANHGPRSIFNRAALSHCNRDRGIWTTACYSMDHIIEDLLVRNDPLDAVWRESRGAWTSSGRPVTAT